MIKRIQFITVFFSAFLFSLNNISAQEIIGQLQMQDYQNTNMTINDNWMFTTYGIEGTNGFYVHRYENGVWQYKDLIEKFNTYQYANTMASDEDWLIVSDDSDYDEPGEIPTSLNFYQLEDTGWTWKQKFTRDFSYFTQAFSIFGDWAVAGDNYSYPGIDSVYLYHLQGDSWVQTQSIAYDDTTHEYALYPNPLFGEHVKMFGDYFVVSAPVWRTSTAAGIEGALYIYKRNSNDLWEKLHTIYLPDYGGPHEGLKGVDLGDGLLTYTVDDFTNGNEIYTFRFDDSAFELIDTIIPTATRSNNSRIKLRGNELVYGDYTYNIFRGIWLYYKLVNDQWQQKGSYTTNINYSYMAYDVEIFNNTVLASDFRTIFIFGVKPPVIGAVSQGNSSSYTKVNWQPNSSLSDLGYIVYRDGLQIAQTSGDARSYFDYEGVPGKMHTYGVSTLHRTSEWRSAPALGYGYKQPAGKISGKVQTPIGSGVRDVKLSLQADGIQMDQALVVDSSANAMLVRPFNDAPDTAITVSFWLKSDPSNQGTLFDLVSELHDNGFTINNPQNITISINNYDISSQVNVADNSWHHLAVSWRSQDGQLRIYDNGILAFGDKFQGGTTFQVPDASISFGANHSRSDLDSLSSPFKGILDELQIWSFVRSDSMIAEEMYTRRVGNEEGLVSCYNFDDPQRFDVDFIPDLVWKRANHGSVTMPVFETGTNNVIHQKREIYSDAAGNFSFKNVYFDEERDFTLLPFKQDHGFQPGSVFLELDLDNPVSDNVVVLDTTSFTVSGRVYYASTDCPLPGAELLLNGTNTGIFTDADGFYQLTIEDPGSVRLQVSFADSSRAHLFIPANIDLQVNDNIFDANFADITTSRLHGRVGAACDNSLGVATLQIIADNQCYSRTIDTDADGNYDVELPSQKYIVTAAVDGSPVQFDIIHTDLTFQDTLLNFIDRQPPTIRISGLPETCFSVPVVGQYERYFLTIEVLDTFGENACPVDTGFVTIYDDIGGDPGEPVTLKISNGQAYYILQPGEPNILDGGEHPFQKLFQVMADVDGVTSSLEQWMLVTGHRPRAETFVTKTPELPLMILRDPPGDQSYSYLEEGQSITSNYSMSREIGGSGGIYTEMKIGAGIPVPFTGVVIGARTHIEGQILAGGGNNKGTTLTTTTTNTERFSTSDADNITGTKGDVFIGASFNMIYALTDIIDFDEGACTVVRDTQLVWGSEEINTDYIYTENHIRNTLLPQLRLLRSLASPDSVVLLGTYIDVWEQVLAENERLKRTARKEKNLSFSSGTSREYSSTITTDSTIHIDFTTFIDTQVKIGAGFGDTKFSDIEVGVAANFRWSKNEVFDTTFQQSTTVGYVLADDDEGDFFSVDVKMDPVYETPVFDLVSGTSSCPWEPGSQPRDGVQLTMDSFVRNDVPLGEKAAFTLFIGNTSQSGESRDYALSVIQASNLDGAIISVGGVVIEDALNYTIPSGEQLRATLAVERGPLAWDYEDLQVSLYSPCDPSIADTVSFSVHFQSPCTDVNIFRPNNNWLVNASNNDTLAIVLNEYDRSDPDLEMILLEYRPVGGSWKTAFTVLKNALPNDYVKRTWNVASLDNGNYELRAVARCQSGLSYSPVLEGKIDRSALVVFGTPQPADGILNIGDDIRIAFSEELDCDNLSESAVQLKDESGRIIPANIACGGKELIVTPRQSLQELEGRLITATVTTVKDITGNILRQPYSWKFRVNINPVYWSVSNASLTFYKNSESPISVVLNNAGIENESFNLISVPAWLSANNYSGSIPPAGTANITFEISRNLNPGLYHDTLYAETTMGNEPYFVQLHILAEPPHWSVNSAQYSYSMNVTAQLNIQGSPSDDPFDMVAAFIDNEVRGKANIQFVSDLYGYLAFITIYSNSAGAEQIFFSGWDASAGNEYANVSESFTFQDGGQLGSLSNPVILNPQGVAQTVGLDSGWTWISLTVQQNPMDINDVLAAVEAQTGDLIKGQQQFSQYVAGGGWQGSLQQLQTGQSYLVQLKSASALRYVGNLVNKNEKFLQLQQGWNWIGFVGNRIVDINTALSELDASDGDLIKSRDNFAEYDAQSGLWLGSLEFLNPGEGYKIRTNSTADFNFSGLDKGSSVLNVPGAPKGWQVRPELFEYNMNLISRLDFGTKSKLDSLDIIAAFVDGQCRGVANPVYIPALNRYQVFLTIFGNEGDSSAVHFKMLERETGVVYAAGDVIAFTADVTIGSIEKPMLIKSAYATNDGALPTVYQLYQNYPNPFNPLTYIRYELPTRTEVSLVIYNVLGQEVHTLVNTTQNAGRYLVEVDGSSLSSGIYFYRLEAGSYNKVLKMLLVK